ncbi:olfactory receptor 5AP2-like [Ambystoma mexicanum]|uniref:olfactory receptor 5AP2-like n=1 Tax=Ambystoma mexicanum TaxID=8296 RepID=UPI0037E8CDD6
MEAANQTSVTEFQLLGLTQDPFLQALLFGLFILIYTMTLLGNIGIIVLIRTDRSLDTPMYLFLSSLSFTDVCYSSVITPELLSGLLVEKASISFAACASQLFFFSGFAGTECLLLGVMAYDRYTAICHPLLYRMIMHRGVCLNLIAISYAGGFLQSAILTGFTFTLSFCGPNHIDKFYCDLPPLLKLSCSNTFISELITFVFAIVIGVASLLTILISYAYIISTIMAAPSRDGRHRAFSTCISHFTCVVLFYGTLLFVYLQPSSSYSINAVVSIFYTVVIPMLNPLIYSLRNQDVRAAARRLVLRRIFQH